MPLLPLDDPARSRVATATARALARWCEATARPALGWASSPDLRSRTGRSAPFLIAAGFLRSGPASGLASLPASQVEEESEA